MRLGSQPAPRTLSNSLLVSNGRFIVSKFQILPDAFVQRLLFATSVMHAYGHQWACQLVYNPRLRDGLGLTEGEGTERVWSKFRKLIGVTRSSGVRLHHQS